MSCGRVVCSSCRREIDQGGPRDVSSGWRHLADGTPRCAGASSDWPNPGELPPKPATWESLRLSRYGIGRNDPCPCGSGRKAKRCCPERVGKA